jgi:hypothetical protein
MTKTFLFATELTVSGKVSGASGAESENPSANRTGGSDRNPKTGDSVTGIGSGGSNSGASNLGGPSLVGGVLGTSQANKCDCESQCSTKEAPSLDKKEKEQQFRISFENYLHNKVYVKQRSVSFGEHFNFLSLKMGCKCSCMGPRL